MPFQPRGSERASDTNARLHTLHTLSNDWDEICFTVYIAVGVYIDTINKR